VRRHDAALAIGICELMSYGCLSYDDLVRGGPTAVPKEQMDRRSFVTQVPIYFDRIISDGSLAYPVEMPSRLCGNPPYCDVFFLACIALSSGTFE
jgi:hypothetical protein